MKHILNNLTEEEKKSIREQHTGGIKIVNENFSKLIKATLGDSKPLVSEQYYPTAEERYAKAGYKEDMKNIHVLPTSQPSRLSILNSGKLNFGAEFISSSNSKAQNIYITSDEEIKEGDWGLSKLNEVILFGRSYNEKFYKKIILTTDDLLIKDGVQAIDDEFLEWFVKNPSCERVEVENDNYVDIEKDEYVDFYEIIIPKEEPKQETPTKPSDF
jgi:hypothetical protein